EALTATGVGTPHLAAAERGVHAPALLAEGTNSGDEHGVVPPGSEIGLPSLYCTRFRRRAKQGILVAASGQGGPQPRKPTCRISRSVCSYASRTHSTIFSGCGEYSSSILSAPSMPSALISRKYGTKSTTPRPGGRSPWTLPSQSLICTWTARPLTRRSSSGPVCDRHRCDTSMLAATAGWFTSSRKRTIESTLLTSDNLNGSSSRAIFSP